MGVIAQHRLRELLQEDELTLRCGVEHEYKVLVAGTQRDFRSLLPGIQQLVPGLDPGDHRARRCSNGGVITADGQEAEIATPPFPVEPGFASRLSRAAEDSTAILLGHVQAVAPGAVLEGYSTHVNVEVLDRRVVAVAQRFASRCSTSMMLLMDRPTSPGLLVRPRHGRLELGGEYVCGDQLRAALTFAVAAADLLRSRPLRHRRALPPALSGRIVRADERFGWFVARDAFGEDLYRHGRRARVHTRDGSWPAGDLLDAWWSAARPRAEEYATGRELETVDGLVDGKLPLPLEADASTAGVASRRLDPPDLTPQGAALRRRRRSGFEVEVVLATWRAVVFRVSRAYGSPRFVLIPDRQLERFLELLDHGALDDLLREALDALPGHATLSQPGQADATGIYDRIGDAGAVTPPERDVHTGRTGGGGPGSRSHKHERSEARPPVSRGRWRIVAVAAAAVVVAGAVVAVLATGGDGGGTRKAGTTRVHPVAAVTARGMTGSYAVRYGAVTTTYSNGVLQGVTPTNTGTGLTYTAADGRTQSLALPTGVLTLSCDRTGCRASGSPQGFSTTGAPDGDRAPLLGDGTSQGVSVCGAPGPPGALGSGTPASADIVSTTAGAAAKLRWTGTWFFSRNTSDTIQDGQCANVVIGTIEVTATRIR